MARVLLALLLCCSVFVVGSWADRALLESLCKESQHGDLCLSSLLADRRSTLCGDKACVASVFLDISLKNVSATINYVNSLIGKRPPEVNKLQDCVTMYSTALDDVKEAIRQMNAKAYWDAENSMTDAARYPPDCENSAPNLLSQQNKMLDDLFDISWELIDNLVPLPPL